MNRAGVTAEWDEETCQNYAEWTSGNATYQIWLEDAESIAVKLNMMATKNIGGVAVWRLGYGTQAAWELINAYLQQEQNNIVKARSRKGLGFIAAANFIPLTVSSFCGRYSLRPCIQLRHPEARTLQNFHRSLERCHIRKKYCSVWPVQELWSVWAAR